MLDSAKYRGSPLWLFISCLLHFLILLIPLLSPGGGEAPGRRVIELVEMGGAGFGGEGLAAEQPPVPISLPQTQSISPPSTTTAASSQKENLPSSEEVAMSTEETPTSTTELAQVLVVPEAPQQSTSPPAHKVAPTDPIQSSPSTASQQEGGTPQLPAPAQGSGDRGAGHSGSSGSSDGGTSAGSGGGRGPSLPGPKIISSSKNLTNHPRPLTLSTVVEFRPNGSYTIVQPLPKPNPASRAEKDAVSIAEKEFMGELEKLRKEFAGLNKPYRLKIEFNFYPRNNQGQMTFQIVN